MKLNAGLTDTSSSDLLCATGFHFVLGSNLVIFLDVVVVINLVKLWII